MPDFPHLRAAPFKSRKPVKWSHQNELDSLKGREIKLFVVGETPGNFTKGTLIEADQFSIKVKAQQSTMTIFKHQIVAFAAA
jgi:sRNA-binding regulator protein Hfq